MTARRRPIKADSFIWCDYHGEVHGRTSSPHGYNERFLDGDMVACHPDNWRPVYILGHRGDEF